MSKKLTDFAKRFVDSSIDANKFAEPYILMWKEERDIGKQWRSTGCVDPTGG
jgi:hypothetical protein